MAVRDEIKISRQSKRVNNCIKRDQFSQQMIGGQLLLEQRIMEILGVMTSSGESDHHQKCGVRRDKLPHPDLSGSSDFTDSITSSVTRPQIPHYQPQLPGYISINIPRETMVRTCHEMIGYNNPSDLSQPRPSGFSSPTLAPGWDRREKRIRVV